MIGDSLGSKSQLYSLIVVVFVILTLLFLGPVLEAFPRAALAALVVWAATRLVDIPELVRIGRFRASELVLALATTAAVLIVDILYGILVAIALSILDLLRRVARPHDGVLGYAPGVAGMHDIDDYPDAKQMPGLLVYRYDSPLFFANAENFKGASTGGDRGARPDRVDAAQLRGQRAGRPDLGRRSRELLDELDAARHQVGAWRGQARDAASSWSRPGSSIGSARTTSSTRCRRRCVAYIDVLRRPSTARRLPASSHPRRRSSRSSNPERLPSPA